MYRFFDRSRENLSRGRDYGRDSLGLRDGSEMVVSDVCVKGKIYLKCKNFIKDFLKIMCLMISNDYYNNLPCLHEHFNCVYFIAFYIKCTLFKQIDLLLKSKVFFLNDTELMNY